MSTERPTVSAELIAALIEATPERVRRRLDRAPDVAASWDWRVEADAWSVDAGGETVRLPHGHLTLVEQVACTCLLAPRCFHVLACLTRLEVAIVDSAPVAEPASSEPALDVAEGLVEPGPRQQDAARALVNSIGQLLRVGVANASVVVQSGLLRGVHQCRAEGLHRLAALGLRVVAGTSELRTRAPASDPAQLAEDLTDALETGRHVLEQKPIASFWIGTARRKQYPVRPRRLYGLFAEPILTRSGFAGAAVYLLGEDDRIYSASDARPGDAQHARDAYLGGIEIGAMVQPAKQLARSVYLCTDMTASQDGRLGRGQGIRIVEQGESTWHADLVEERFRRPLAEQWDNVYAQAALPAEARPAGWDLVFLQGAVVGAAGAELILHLIHDNGFIRLAIDNDSPLLYFRENLRMLSHAPGLRLRVIARLNLQEPGIVGPLAIAPEEGNARTDNEPRLELPSSLAGRICLGLDEIQSKFLIHARASAVVLRGEEGLHGQSVPAQPLDALRRRWIATMLSGLGSQRASGTTSLTAEMAALHRSGFVTAAALLDALAGSHAGTGGSDTFLATAVYLRSARNALAKASASAEAVRT
jgi:hypothetical protein